MGGIATKSWEKQAYCAINIPPQKLTIKFFIVWNCFKFDPSEVNLEESFFKSSYPEQSKFLL